MPACTTKTVACAHVHLTAGRGRWRRDGGRLVAVGEASGDQHGSVRSDGCSARGDGGEWQAAIQALIHSELTGGPARRPFPLPGDPQKAIKQGWPPKARDSCRCSPCPSSSSDVESLNDQFL